jgi:hypothetical protein
MSMHVIFSARSIVLVHLFEQSVLLKKAKSELAWKTRRCRHSELPA